MADTRLPATFGAQMLLEAPERVVAVEVADRVVLTFGDDLHGVRFMGDREVIRRLLARAGRAIAEAGR